MSRILSLCYEYPPLGGGGGRVAAQVATALVERGHQVLFITAGMSHLPFKTTIDGVEVIRVRARRSREDTCTIFEMMLWILAATPVVLKEAWRWRPDVIHVHFAVPTGMVAWVVHQFTRIPYVLTVHLGDVPGGVPQQTDRIFKLIKPFTIPIWRGAAGVTAVSSFVSELAKRAYGIQPRVILNGVKLFKNSPFSNNGSTSTQSHAIESEFLKDGAVSISIDNSKCHQARPAQLLMVGRLSIQKNPLFAIQALALLRDLSWTLKLIGEGPLFASVKEEVIRYGLEEKITFLGWLEAAEVEQTMKQSDVLLIPSLSEGLPMVGVEALAEGLAIVGSRIGGLQDIIEEDQNGYFFDLEKGPFAMAKAIQSLIENPKHLDNMKKASLQKAKDFEWSRSIDAYEQLLESCYKS